MRISSCLVVIATAALALPTLSACASPSSSSPSSTSSTSSPSLSSSASSAAASSSSTTQAGGDDVAALAVRQRAATELACAPEQLDVALVDHRGTLRPAHERNTFVATGCGASAVFVAVCVENDDGGACRAVRADDDRAGQMSPYAE